MEWIMYTIGIDPDSEKHGVAIYDDNKLIVLTNMALPELNARLILPDDKDKRRFSIENVMANQFVYARNRHQNKAVESKIAMHIGRCQQSQIELMRFLDAALIPYELHKPQKGNWAKNRKQFELVTGWNKRSNEDTRAAAFFGYLSLR